MQESCDVEEEPPQEEYVTPLAHIRGIAVS